MSTGPSSREPEAIPLISQGGDQEWVDDFAREDPSNTPAFGGESHNSKARNESHFGRSSSPLSRYLLYGAVFISLLSLFCNAIFLLTWKPRSQTRKDNELVKSLRRPSQYLGIERVPQLKVALSLESMVAHATASHAGHSGHGSANDGPMPSRTISLATEPTRSASSSRALREVRVNSLFPDDEFGDDGWITLTAQDRMLLEFHSPLDAVKCAFIGHFPIRDDLGGSHLTIEHDDEQSQSSFVEIRQISDLSALPHPLNTTWNTRPASSKLLGQLQVAFGVESVTKPTFSCIPGQPLLVELTCISKDCRIEYRDQETLPLIGIELGVF
ncbi:hypothetical protein K474DRAFT_1664862 [Panus rudis PR-1116 ss-1]|nr:hypothetical protein K474DRAFT_1664862 [Panus rudis PR-1116 ss-1]